MTTAGICHSEMGKRRRKVKLKTLWRWLKVKVKSAWRWLRREVLNVRMIFWLFLAEVIFWSPCIVTGILALCVSPTWWTAFTGYIALWSVIPCTPAVPLQVALAYGLKRLCGWIRRKMQKKKGGDKDDERKD